MASYDAKPTHVDHTALDAVAKGSQESAWMVDKSMQWSLAAYSGSFMAQYAKPLIDTVLVC